MHCFCLVGEDFLDIDKDHIRGSVKKSYLWYLAFVMDNGVWCDHVLIVTHLIQIFFMQMMRMGFREVGWLTQNHTASLSQAWKHNPDLLTPKVMFPAKNAGYKLPTGQRYWV